MWNHVYSRVEENRRKGVRMLGGGNFKRMVG